MNHDYLIHFLIRQAQSVLGDIPARSAPDLADTATNTIRALISAPAAQLALKKSSDTFRAFALRAVGRILRDDKMPSRVILDCLRDVLDEPTLKQALDDSPRSRTYLWAKRPHDR
jgi:hypothetical protein